MDKVSVTLKVFFQDPFWVGVVERVEKDILTVSKVTFGAEPKDYEVSAFFLENYYRLRFSPAVGTVVKEMHANPKRMQREARKLLKETGVGTKSQQALKLKQEQNKTEREEFNREQREADKLRRFELKQQKKKEKHRGR
ncbi:MAG: YjdF family protein [Eubacteriales bacterium]|nr:YjdF family protein [Eubacteriales bacterium]